MIDQTDTTEADLRAAVNQALIVATKKPTGQNRKNLKAAQKALGEYLENQLQPTEPIFNSIEKMIESLGEKGWSCSVSSAYDHIKAGKLRVSNTKKIRLTEALEYAREHLRKKDGTSGDISLQEEKLRHQINQIDYDSRMRELKYRQALGELIPKTQVEIELAARATNLKNYLDAVARKAAGRMCKIVSGDPQKVPHLIEFLLGTNRKAFGNYSKPIQGLDDEE